MSGRAKLFVAMTVVSGGALIASCLARPNLAQPDAYLTFSLLALFASALKVRLPGITGTISMNFLFILVAVAVFSFSETVLLAAAAGLVQCFWKAKRRPSTVQVSFNVATLAIGSGFTYRMSHLLAGGSGVNLAVLLVLACCLYFTANTLMVSGVLSLVQKKPLFQVWRQCYLWSFAYYLVGAEIAGLVVVTNRNMGWASSLMVMPLMFLVYVFYKILVERMVQTSTSTGVV